MMDLFKLAVFFFRVHFYPDILNNTIKHNLTFNFQDGYKENQSGETEL